MTGYATIGDSLNEMDTGIRAVVREIEGYVTHPSSLRLHITVELIVDTDDSYEC